MNAAARNDEALREQGDEVKQKTKLSPHNTAIKSRFKALIVAAYCWGLLPVKLADWLIQRGGMRDA